jgi:predicted TIM-barrel fold metal-dependent hydrolase
MKNKKIVDCHMHTLNKKEFELYMKTSSASTFINIRGLYIEECLNPYDFEDFLDNKNMYFIDSIDLNDIDNELLKIEKDLKKYPRIIGIKIYLGYQKYYANDKRIYRIAEFAKIHKLSVTFHCGEIYDENGESSYSPYSDAKFIKELAEEFPEVNFIASHINWPNFEDLFYLCNKYDNVYTCFSGCNDGETLLERNKQNKDISEVINSYLKKHPKIKKKIMYGTDFFGFAEEYSDVSSYIKIVDLLDINELEKADIVYNNVCKAYNTMF